MNDFVFLCHLNDLNKNKGNIAILEGKKIAVFYNGREAFATTPFCPHARANLAQGGHFKDKTVTCHWHGWSFDAESGKGLNNESELKVYKTKIVEDKVYIIPEIINKNEQTLEPFPDLEWK